MDGHLQRLRTHDYTILTTLGLAKLYGDIGLRLEEAKINQIAESETNSHESFAGVYSSPRTPGRSKKLRSSSRPHRVNTNGGDSSSTGVNDADTIRRRKSAFDGDLGSSSAAFARVQTKGSDTQSDISGGLGLRKHAGKPKVGQTGPEADANGVDMIDTRPREYGEVWFNRYMILAKLGEGAFSQAFLAADTHCTRMGRRHDGTRLVSIKRMGAQEGAIGIADYHSISTLNALDPRARVPIVRIYDMFMHQTETESRVCLVMEPLLGGTLHDTFPRRIAALYAAQDTEVARKMHIDMIRKVVKQLLAALAHMHSNSLIHADVKTTNIICVDSQSLRAKLIDFGNAVSDGDVSEYYKTFEIQTVWFRAPEVAYQRPFGRAIDIWSVGCVMCELWLGRPLFTDMDNHSLIRSMLKLRGLPPASLYASSPVYSEAVRIWSSGRPTPSPGFAPAVVRGRLHGSHNLGMGVSSAEQSLDWDPQLRMHWLKHSLHVDDNDFVSLADSMLEYDPEQRPTAAEALQHPFFDNMF
ncbi:hypothetical protein GGI15_004180 [Coemansia interrupta]|uniref:Protein kinase domain-containing protein n=1 Tax=Coemansia interrupta TaxID=1126814 RepID=A0A9W8H3V1_9FUNG|nr:hypothetical protein GGI15_004180 [Coemansia interrupta]